MTQYEQQLLEQYQRTGYVPANQRSHIIQLAQQANPGGMDIFGQMANQPQTAYEEPETPLPASPAGTNGTPFLNYGVPGTSSPGGSDFTDPPGFWNMPPPVTTAPPTVPPPAIPFNPVNPGPYGLENLNHLDPAGIPSINLPEAGQINPEYGQGFQDWYTGMMNKVGSQIKDQFGYQLPQMTAPQMNVEGIPQPRAQAATATLPGPTSQAQAFTPESFAALDFLQTGQGFDPATLAQMRSRAVEDASGAGRMELGQTKRALEQAGISGSPAGAAVAGDVARRTGAAQSSALRDIDIENAMTGVENRRIGAGMESNRRALGAQLGTQTSQFNTGQTNQANLVGAQLGTQVGLSNMQAANQMALENANRLFSGMSQNLQMQQQTQSQQFGEEANKLSNQAGTTANFLGNEWGGFSQAALGKKANAESQNVQNTMTQQQRQAELERTRQLANQNALEGRWTTAATGLPAWSPLPGANQQPYSGFSPFGG